MNGFQLIELDSVAALRGQARAWDDLWQRSESAGATGRAELVAQWCERFAAKTDFRALAVAEGGTWRAALPLVGVRVGRLLRAGCLAANSWDLGGRLLLDPGADADKALDALAQGMAGLPWTLFWLGHAALDAPAWKALARALRRAGMTCSVLARHEVGWLVNDHDCRRQSQRISAHGRKEIGRLWRRLCERGPVVFRLHAQFEPDALANQLRRAFEVEHRSWKGRAGTSVIGAGMLPFIVRQAEQLARRGSLRLAVLDCGDRPVAFAYATFAKGVLAIAKTGYDEEYAACAPGRLVMHALMEHVWRDAEIRAIDFVGPMAGFQRAWRPATYRVGRLVASSRGPLGRAAVHAHERWWPGLRAWRRWLRGRLWRREHGGPT